RRAPRLRARRLLERERPEPAVPRGRLRRPPADRTGRRFQPQLVGPFLARAVAAGVPRPRRVMAPPIGRGERRGCRVPLMQSVLRRLAGRQRTPVERYWN